MNIHPLSSVQQAVWFDQMLAPEVPFYNIGMALLTDGDLQLPVLEQALTGVVRANDALRLVLCPGAGPPQQRLLPPFEVTLEIVDFSQHAQPQEAAWDYMQTAFRKPFNFAAGGLLWQWQIVRVDAARHYIFQRFHHLVADAFSVSIVSFRMLDIYNHILRGESMPERAAPSYLDFIAEDQAYLASERFARDKAFWSERFAQVPPGWVSPAREVQTQKVLPSEEIQWPV
ncbi:MAG: condensation domain-containing protein, partial [Acidobacteriota bacterium]|nr:condensation domain-containing protein [Acidobacteriota bacterium]